MIRPSVPQVPGEPHWRRCQHCYIDIRIGAQDERLLVDKEGRSECVAGISHKLMPAVLSA